MRFTDVVKKYAAEHPSWADGDDLRLFARLRNFVVHSKTAPYQRLAISPPDLVEEIESIRERLAERVLPRFQRKVTTVQLSDTLAHVLGIINENSFSQFPVYSVGDEYRGLLTENGITRWLAHHTARELTLVEFEDVTVEELLSEEEPRPNCVFVSKDAAADTVASNLGRNPYLEAALITEKGNEKEDLLGIATDGTCLNWPAGQNRASEAGRHRRRRPRSRGS
jgi:predicted transcriptional regulator